MRFSFRENIKRSFFIFSVIAFPVILNFSFSKDVFASSSALELVSANFSGTTNGVFNPGGTYGLTATITAINATAASASVVLSSSDSCVTISQNTANYGNIAVSQNVDNTSTPFQFSISSTCPVLHMINLDLTLSAAGYSSSPIIIPVLVSVPPVPYITPPYTCVTNYYVSTNGSDSNNGTSVGQAWYSIEHAITYLKGLGGTHGGVCVNVQPGVYNAINYASTLSGTSDTPTGYLVFRSMMLHGADVQVPAANATSSIAASFRFDEEHYIIIDGFNLEGQVISGSDESGVVSNAYGTPGDHLKVINNISAFHGGAGIGATHTDYFVAEGNIVFGNSNTSPGEESGITSWQAVASDSLPGFHNIISDNISFNNGEVNNGHTTHSDGNGIVIDDFRNTQAGSPYGVYTQQTLVENNLVFNNLGRGIHVFSSDDVTVVNNSTRGNEQDPIGLGTWRSEIDAINSANDVIVNNIAVAVEASNEWGAPNVSLMDNSTNSSNINNIWHNNLSFNGTAGQLSTMTSGSSTPITSAQGNVLGKDPQYLNPGAVEFTLQSGSPAILAGTSVYGFPSTDLAGNTRPASAIDLGAYQYSDISSYSLSVTNTGNGFGMVYGTTSTNSNFINCGVNTGATICSGTLNSGTVVTLSAAAASNSTFTGWTVSGSPAGTCTGTTSPCTITVTSATSVIANFLPQTFVLTASAGSNGSIAPSGAVSVNYGASQTFTLTPNSGYNAQLMIDGNVVTLTNNAYTITDVTAPHTVTASFSVQVFETVTATAGSGGTISPSGSVSVMYGTNQTFTITPNVGYAPQLTVDGTPVTLTNNAYTLINVTTAHTVAATFNSTQTETLTVGLSTGGGITPVGTVIVDYGASQTFTLHASPGYVIVNLTVDSVPVTLTNNAYTLTNITANHTLKANFSPQSSTYTITASFGAGGAISPSGSVTVDSGANQIFTVIPNAGYAAQLLVDGSAVTLANNTYTLTNVTANHTVTATFSLQTETVTASAGSGGTITPSGSVNVSYGASQTFTLTPNAGYTPQLSVDGSIVPLTNNAYTLNNISTSHTVLASFTLQTENISASAGSNGTITPSGSVSVNYGSTQTFTLIPNTGYTAQLTVDGSTVSLTNNAYTLTNVTTSHTLIASFSAASTVTLSVGFGVGGIITPNGSVSVNYGTSQTFTLTASFGYSIQSLTVDGTAVTLTGNTYTLTDVTASHILKANFTSQTETINVSAGSGGAITPSGSVSVAYGSNQTFTVTPNTGYTPQLTVDGTAVSLTNNAYTLSNVTTTHTVVASFTLQSETITASSGSNGTITPSGSVSVNYGSNQTFTITPNTGYTAQLTVDGLAVALINNAYTLNNVTASHTVVASFTPTVTETLTVGFGVGGIITPYGSVVVNYGANQTFTLKASSGYTIGALTVDGTAVTLTGGTYILTNVTSNHTIKANFTKAS